MTHPKNDHGQPSWTAAGVAAYLGLSPTTIYDWAANGRIDAVRLDGRTWFDPANSQQWLDTREGRFAVTCAVCGAEFRSNHSRAKYCTRSCHKRRMPGDAANANPTGTATAPDETRRVVATPRAELQCGVEASDVFIGGFTDLAGDPLGSGRLPGG
jgi:excisionase family DNA binding protein